MLVVGGGMGDGRCGKRTLGSLGGLCEMEAG